jgi:hypothetical protein
MEFELKPKVDQLTEGFTDIEKRQIPYATSWAMARLGNFARDGIVKSMDALLDRPTKYTKSSVRVRWENRPDGLHYFIFINEWAPKGTPAVKYLFPQVEGGERNETRFERALRFAGKLPAGMSTVPAQGAPKDAHGNVRNGFHTSVLTMLQASTDALQNQTEHSAKRKAAAYRGKLFVGRPGGGRLPLGIYQRLGMRPLWLFVDRRPVYRKRVPFFELVQGIFNAKYPEFFKAAMEEAIRTAK